MPQAFIKPNFLAPIQQKNPRVNRAECSIELKIYDPSRCFKFESSDSVGKGRTYICSLKFSIQA